QPGGAAWVVPLAHTSEQLTVLHRAGLLHGDVKPANVIVAVDGAATLVDLGLAAPWKEGGTMAKGLTPKYAAPELFEGAPLTVRAEVYALGATLADAVKRRGSELEPDVRAAFQKIAARATENEPNDRYPSVDEFASALRHAGKIPPANVAGHAAWPVLGVETTAEQLRVAVSALAPGDVLAIEGARGSGRTTLARRLAWTLGVEGRPAATIAAPPSSARIDAAIVEMELGSVTVTSGLVIVVDDAHLLDGEARKLLARAANDGARIVAVGARETATELRASGGATTTFEVPPLDDKTTEDLVGRSMPSLPAALVRHLVREVSGRPGKLRAILRELAGRAIVSAEDIDAALEDRRHASLPPSSPITRDEAIARAEKSVEMGRIDEAEQKLAELGEATNAEERVRFAIAAARLSLGRGAFQDALARLEAVAKEAKSTSFARPWKVALARTYLRSGDYARASTLAEQVSSESGEGGVAADALTVLGIALAFTGDEARGQRALSNALAAATRAGDRRIEAVALGAMAIVHQRGGRNTEARTSYEASLAAAEEARDAATVALTRLNLAGLARMEGDLSLALTHLEAAVDMGRRAGGLIAVHGALLNLANLDLYLGRFARARASIGQLAEERERLSATNQATLLGLEAELAARTGELTRGVEKYEASGQAWEAQGRPLDAAEARLEGILARAREPNAPGAALGRALGDVKARMAAQGGFGEHEPLLGIVEGTVALVAGDETGAKLALDRALVQAEKAGRREWAWLALEARARLAASQGSMSLARRDVDAALAILEETAAKLPRDLREVFWDDPRRRSLRQANLQTQAVVSGMPSGIPSATRVSGARTGHGATTLLGGPLPAEDRLARIFEITRELATEHDMPRLLSKVTDHAIALLGAERGFVVLANDRGELETHAARDRKGDDLHAQFSRSVAERVVRTGEPVIVSSAKDDEQLKQAVSVHQLMIQSIACVPIRGAPPALRPIGALYLETRLRPGSRFQDELPTLAAFADQAAIAIENARLLEENRARAEELATANIELAAAKDKLAENLERRTEQLATTRRDLKEVRAQLRSHFGYAGLVGTSAPMRKLYALIDRIKETDVPVLITGESGTGKEVVAKAVHASGPRAKRAFLGVNCGAIPANLLESELFGNVKGAFTGAERDRKGLFRECEGGTILLDEIGEMPAKMQAGLLRVLQESTVRPVGGAKEEPVDVRVIAATNRELEAMVAEGSFREDLFYRLHVIELRVPPLRERLDDIPSLIDHFLTLFAARYRRDRKSVDRDALRRLSSYDWPGNVRQLEHVLLNAWLMGEGNELMLEDFELPDAQLRAPSVAPRAPALRDRRSGAPPAAARTKAEFKDTERERILAALTSCNWNRVQAARMLGVPRRTF
ncbi:MAG: Response regulator of zinc sigma-54-dependent two-component system, partial [Myxococcaceae bacterium]|nr:Response regulator of zinc sigma-54-dependent two-component system [Myxococcaceae bacterium]